MSDTALKRARTGSVVSECRACLGKIKDDSSCVDLFCAWDPSWSGMGASIAEDLIKISNIQISASDPHSKHICKRCCIRLQDAIDFTLKVQKNDLLLRNQHKESSDEDPQWPKPIQVDKNILTNNEMTVEVKQEMLSEDEYETGNESIQPDLEIKIEPEEITPMGVTSAEIEFDEPAVKKVKTSNGPSELLVEREFDDVKEEPVSEDECEQGTDIAKDCMLCLKTFNTVKGLKISRMTGSKPRKRGSTWDEVSLRRAMEAVQNSQLNTYAAALKFNIPRRTLRNHLLSGNSTKTIGKSTILTKQLEEDLTQRIKRFAKLGVPLTSEFIRKQAFLFCERFKINHSFNMSTRMAGRKWLEMYLIRNPSISKRKPQVINPARAQKMNKPIVKHHFEEVKKLYEELDIIAHPERLYTMDEKGCRITDHKQSVVLAEKGNTRVNLAAPELAENVTIAMCVNAVGNAIPPMIIFKGIRYRSELGSNLPYGTKVSMAPKGSMTSSLFVEFIQHFAQHKAAGKCLLIFDAAKCHLTYEALEEADKNHIELYCLPSDTTHELQPLEKSVNPSFEHHWDEEVLNYLCNSLETTLNKVAFNKIFSRTWPKCITQTNITNGFKATGLYPLDPGVIPEDAYAPSIISERPMFSSTSEEKTVSTSPKLSAATENGNPILVPYSPSTDASDMELGNTINDQCSHILKSSVHRFNNADTKQDALPSLYDNPVPSTSGLQKNIDYSSHESDLDLNLSESLIKNNYKSKLQVSSENPDQKEQITPKKQLIRHKTKAQQNSPEISASRSSDDDEPLINLIQKKQTAKK